MLECYQPLVSTANALMQPPRHLRHAISDLAAGQPISIGGLTVQVPDAEHVPAGAKLVLPYERAKHLGAVGDAPVVTVALDGLLKEAVAQLINPLNRSPLKLTFMPEPSSAVLCAMKLAKHIGLLPSLMVCTKEKMDPEVIRLTVAEVEAYLAAPPRLKQVTPEAVPLPLAHHEDARVLGFEDEAGVTHLAVLIGKPEKTDAPLTRIHSSCITGDVLASLRCDCGTQLKEALSRMADAKTGVLLYLNQEGRGIGLAHKLRAYALQTAGLDTFDANEWLGFAADERDFSYAAAMLKALHIGSVTLLTNNQEKPSALAACDIYVTKVEPLLSASNPHNHAYLQTKIERFGHTG